MNKYYADLIEKLNSGETVSHKGHGNSMLPIIKSGQVQHLRKPKEGEVKVGDAVLCKVNSNIFTHKVYAIKTDGGKTLYQIGNNRGWINGWTEHVYGLLVGLGE